MKRIRPLYIFFRLLIISTILVISFSGNFVFSMKKLPSNDSIILPGRWSEQNTKRHLKNVNGVYWLGENGRTSFQNFNNDSSILGFTLEPDIGEGFDLVAKLSNKLKKNYVYELEFEINADKIDSSLKRIGISFSPSEGYIMDPLFRFSRYELDSALKPNQWEKISIPLFAGDNEDKIIIHCIWQYSQKVKTHNACLIKNIQLKLIGNAMQMDPDNLVINGDFEYYKNCPTELQSGEGSFFYWQKEEQLKNKCVCSGVNNYSIVSINSKDSKISMDGIPLGSPDLYCVCSNLPEKMPLPYRGRCFAMLNLYVDGLKRNEGYGEYLQTELREKLKKDHIYELSFAYELAPFSRIATNTLGIKFTPCPFMMDSLQQHQIMPDGDLMVSDFVLPNDSVWQTATLKYIAKGDEKYLTIGPFWKNGVKGKIERETGKYKWNEAYYLIDDIRMIEITPLKQ